MSNIFTSKYFYAAKTTFYVFFFDRAGPFLSKDTLGSYVICEGGIISPGI